MLQRLHAFLLGFGTFSVVFFAIKTSGEKVGVTLSQLLIHKFPSISKVGRLKGSHGTSSYGLGRNVVQPFSVRLEAASLIRCQGESSPAGLTYATPGVCNHSGRYLKKHHASGF